MAQYDVYENPNARSRDAVPYVVDVQSHLLERLRTRLVMPLSRLGADMTDGLPRRLVPRVVVAGERLMLLAHQAAVIEARHLRRPVTSIATGAHEIVDALDAVVSGV